MYCSRKIGVRYTVHIVVTFRLSCIILKHREPINSLLFFLNRWKYFDFSGNLLSLRRKQHTTQTCSKCVCICIAVYINDLS